MTPTDRMQRTRAHAKLNLSLRVLDREPSGYHHIDTLFCLLDLADDITITLTPSGVALDVASADAHAPAPDLGPVESNLALRAARLLIEHAQHRGGVHIRLVKRIPEGAGLGGGSSDAAAVLTSLNEMLQMPLPGVELMSLGARLGSDVPFFISGARLAIGRDRGDRIEALPGLPRATVLLAVPPERVSTAGAYAALAESRTSVHAPGDFEALTDLASWDDVRAIAHNDFEPTVFAVHPRIGALRNALENAGAKIARLTGTGSVVFGIFDGDEAALAAAERIRAEYPDVMAVLTHTRAATVL